MDSKEFRQRGREMVDYIADYLENIENRRVLPEVQPGYLRDMLPKHAPQVPDSWDDVMKDVERCIMPGVTHWQHPHFHAYYPINNSYPSILADMLSGAIGSSGFSWAACPASAELEMLVMDWLASMLGLPEKFLHTGGVGGGVIQGSASECVFISMLVARHKTLKQLSTLHPHIDEGVLLSKLVAYRSKLAHSCVEKAGMLSLVKMRELDIDENYSLRGCTLEQAIQDDKKKGLVPFYILASIGTTAVCSYDNIEELGSICAREDIWMHVDAAYAGCALVCPETRHRIKGIQNVRSFNMNPHKLMLVNVDCSAFWIDDKEKMTSTMTVEPLYLQHSFSDKSVDFRNWGITLCRRFRSLKIWFVLRSYGVTGLQKIIRNHCRLAKYFESLMSTDTRFQIIGEVTLGLVCFKLKDNDHTQKLLDLITLSGKLYMVPSCINGDLFIRFVLCFPQINDEQVKTAWSTIKQFADKIMETKENGI